MLRRGTRQADDGFALAIIGVAIALSTVWAIFVPFFQQQDESDHFDYAMTLASAHRLIAGGEGHTGGETHPYVRRLMDLSDGRSVRVDIDARVPADYGSAAYYVRVDRIARDERNDLQRYHAPAIDPVPYISKLYPFPYYALTAGAIQVAAFARPGSAVAAFFAARAANVGIFTIGLWCWWQALNLAGISRRSALAILACSAWLPLADWIGSYEQPDNLAFCVIGAAAWASLRANAGPGGTGSYVVTGLSLALLIATKRQDALALFLPVAAAAAVRVHGTRARIATAFALCVPVALAYALTEYFLRASSEQIRFCALGPAVRSGAAGPLDVAGHMLATAPATLAAIYGFHSVFLQFWLGFGAYYTPIIIGSQEFTIILAMVLEAATLAVLGLFCVRFVRNSGSLVTIARRRSLRAALRIATRNTFVNAYLVYVVILIGFEGLSPSIALQGRYFYPFLPAIFFIAIVIAPRALPRRVAPAFARVIAAGVVAFSLTANAWAYPSIRARYYDPPQHPAASHEVLVKFGGASGYDFRSVWDYGVVPQGKTVHVYFTAIDLRNVRPAPGASLVVDGVRFPAHAMPFRGALCLPGSPRSLWGSFEATISAGALPPGQHTIAVDVDTPWSPRPIRSAATAAFTLR